MATYQNIKYRLVPNEPLVLPPEAIEAIEASKKGVELMTDAECRGELLKLIRLNGEMIEFFLQTQSPPPGFERLTIDSGTLNLLAEYAEAKGADLLTALKHALINSLRGHVKL